MSRDWPSSLADISAACELVLELSTGEHTLRVALAAECRDGIRYILEEVAGSTGRARIILRK